MKNLLSRFWQDDAGFVISSELVLVATILVIGLIAGLTSVRDQVTQELGDVAGAISQVNQSYAYEGVTGHSAAVHGSIFADNVDFCDAPADAAGAPPVCILIDGTTPVAEGDSPIDNIP